MKKNTKRILAIVAILLLVLLSISTLVIAVLDFPGKERLFMASALAMIFLPILLWVYIWLYGIYSGRRTLASVWPEDELPIEEEISMEEENSAKENQDNSDPTT